jgi:hypothetical protein
MYAGKYLWRHAFFDKTQSFNFHLRREPVESDQLTNAGQAACSTRGGQCCKTWTRSRRVGIRLLQHGSPFITCLKKTFLIGNTLLHILLSCNKMVRHCFQIVLGFQSKLNIKRACHIIIDMHSKSRPEKICFTKISNKTRRRSYQNSLFPTSHSSLIGLDRNGWMVDRWFSFPFHRNLFCPLHYRIHFQFFKKQLTFFSSFFGLAFVLFSITFSQNFEKLLMILTYQSTSK